MTSSTSVGIRPGRALQDEPADLRIQFEMRDPTVLATDLERLQRHYLDEAARLRAESARLHDEARDARQAALECRAWRANLGQRRTTD